MHLTIKDVIQLFQEQSIKLVAGASEIDTPVLSVNIMDAPDVWNWVKPGQLILTTAFAVKDDIVLQQKLITNLKRAGCAGLGVKTKRFLPEIPVAMCELANQLGLPILELPLNLSLADVMIPIISNIASRQSYLLQRSNEIHSYLTKVAISGGGLGAIIDCLGKLIQCPVACYDTNGYLINSWLPTIIPDINEENFSQLQKYLHNKTDNNVFLKDKLIKTKSPFTQSVIADNIEFFATSFVIMSSNEFFGHITILQMSATFLDINCLALEHTCTVAALDFLKQKAVAESRRLHSRDLLERLILDDLNDSQNFSDIFSSSSLKTAKIFRCTAIELDETDEELNIPVVATKLYKIVQQIVAVEYPLSLISEHAGKIIALMAAVYSLGDSGNSIHSKIQTAFMEKCSNLNISIGIGSTVSNIAQIRQSYHEALNCLKFGRKLKGNGHITEFQEIAVYSLLAGTQAEKILYPVCAATITKLEQADNNPGMELLKTLEKYLECDKNLTETAKNLYIHRNTLSNRLQKITEVGKLDFADHEFLFCLQLYFRQKKIADIT